MLGLQQCCWRLSFLMLKDEDDDRRSMEIECELNISSRSMFDNRFKERTEISSVRSEMLIFQLLFHLKRRPLRKVEIGISRLWKIIFVLQMKKEELIKINLITEFEQFLMIQGLIFEIHSFDEDSQSTFFRRTSSREDVG